MKNFWITLAVALAACLATFGVFYKLNADEALHRAAREGDAMAWLRAEFHLNDAQFASIQKLHDDYGVVCAEHCALITRARQQPASSAEIARLEQVCVDAMTTHFRKVAATMPAREGDRYLAMVLPRIPGYQHVGAPNLQATH
jgi:hypothetical protein